MILTNVDNALNTFWQFLYLYEASLLHRCKELWQLLVWRFLHVKTRATWTGNTTTEHHNRLYSVIPKCLYVVHCPLWGLERAQLSKTFAVHTAPEPSVVQLGSVPSLIRLFASGSFLCMLSCSEIKLSDSQVVWHCPVQYVTVSASEVVTLWQFINACIYLFISFYLTNNKTGLFNPRLTHDILSPQSTARHQKYANVNLCISYTSTANTSLKFDMFLFLLCIRYLLS